MAFFYADIWEKIEEFALGNQSSVYSTFLSQVRECFNSITFIIYIHLHIQAKKKLSDQSKEKKYNNRPSCDFNIMFSKHTVFILIIHYTTILHQYLNLEKHILALG